MATVITHVVVAMAAGKIAFAGRMPPRFWLLAATCSALPDLDVVLHLLGVDYADPLGHRGFFHSPFFAAIIAAIVMLWPARPLVSTTASSWWALYGFFFLLTASHGVIDAFTDGGLGIAFLAPLSNERFFMPWAPLVVPQIGLANVLSSYTVMVLRSELLWIWLPAAVLVVVAHAARRVASTQRATAADRRRR